MANSVEIYGKTITPAIDSLIIPDGWKFGNRLIASDWEPAEFRLPTNNLVITSLAANVKITGRTLQRRQGDLYIRVQIEIVGDGEPSEFFPGWMRVD